MINLTHDLQTLRRFLSEEVTRDNHWLMPNLSFEEKSCTSEIFYSIFFNKMDSLKKLFGLNNDSAQLTLLGIREKIRILNEPLYTFLFNKAVNKFEEFCPSHPIGKLDNPILQNLSLELSKTASPSAISIRQNDIVIPVCRTGLHFSTAMFVALHILKKAAYNQSYEQARIAPAQVGDHSIGISEEEMEDFDLKFSQALCVDLDELENAYDREAEGTVIHISLEVRLEEEQVHYVSSDAILSNYSPSEELVNQLVDYCNQMIKPESNTYMNDERWILADSIEGVSVENLNAFNAEVWGENKWKEEGLNGKPVRELVVETLHKCALRYNVRQCLQLIRPE